MICKNCKKDVDSDDMYDKTYCIECVWEWELPLSWYDSQCEDRINV